MCVEEIAFHWHIICCHVLSKTYYIIRMQRRYILVNVFRSLHACRFLLSTYEVKSKQLCSGENNSSLYTYSLKYKHLYRASMNLFVLTSKAILLYSITRPKQKILTLLYFLSSSTYLYFYFSPFFLCSFVFLHPFFVLAC